MVRRHVLAGVLALVFAVPALSQAAPADRQGRGVNAREQRQAKRIRKGVKSSEITPAELDKLRADEASLRAEERVYRASGKGLNTREYKDLQKDLNRVSREISRATRNNHVAGQ